MKFSTSADESQILRELKTYDVCNSLKFKLLGNLISVHSAMNTFTTVSGIRLIVDESSQTVAFPEGTESKIKDLSITCSNIKYITKTSLNARLVDTSNLVLDAFSFVVEYRECLITFKGYRGYDDYEVSIKESVSKKDDNISFALEGSIKTSRQFVKFDIDRLIDSFKLRKIEIKGDE